MSKAGPAADRDMMRLVAELYYIRDLRQPVIAELTGFSISKVSRLLAQAREAGVVRIAVEPASEERPALADELAKRFGIEVLITPGRELDPAAAARLSGVAAADVVIRELPESGIVGVAAGFTVGAMASALPQRSCRWSAAGTPSSSSWTAISSRAGSRIGSARRLCSSTPRRCWIRPR